MKKHLFYTVEDFVDDINFIRWATGKEENTFYDNFYEKYPHKRGEMDEAIEIIRFLEGSYSGLDDKEVYKLWKKIKAQKSQKNDKGFFQRKLRWVAMVLILIGIGIIAYNYNFQQWNVDDYTIENFPGKNVNMALLVISKEWVVQIPSDSVNIKYKNNGKILLNSRELNFSKDSAPIHKLIIPFGKRGKLELVDGSEITVNSGSQVIFPSTFSRKRKVYLTGEAFFDIKRRKNNPFRVETSDLEVNVLGTAFNVTSYKEDTSIQTIVAEGKVKVHEKGFSLFGKELQLSSSQRVIYDKENKIMKEDHVDIRYHISWKDGYLFLDEEKLGMIARKLTRIYNVDIKMDRSLRSLEFSGKLDLRKDLETELKILSAAHPIQYTLKNDEVIIKPKS